MPLMRQRISGEEQRHVTTAMPLTQSGALATMSAKDDLTRPTTMHASMITPVGMIEDGVHRVLSEYEDTIEVLGHQKGVAFIKPGYTVPLAQCAVCQRHHMWLTKHRHTRELVMRCFDWPLCRGTILKPQEQPIAMFLMSTRVENGNTNMDFSLGAPLSLSNWRNLVLKVARCGKIL